MVGVVGTKTWMPRSGWGSAKGKRSRHGEPSMVGSIITSLHVTTDCSAVSQLARLDPSTVSAVSVSAGILLFLSRDSLCSNTDTNSETKPTSQMTSIICLRKV